MHANFSDTELELEEQNNKNHQRRSTWMCAHSRVSNTTNDHRGSIIGSTAAAGLWLVRHQVITLVHGDVRRQYGD